jgi:hypothetical protein
MDTKRFSDILEFIYDNERVSEQKLKDFSGDEDYKHFFRLVGNLGADKEWLSTRENGIALRPEGVKHLLELKKEKSRNDQTNLMILATIIAAASAFFSAYSGVWGQSAAQEFSKQLVEICVKFSGLVFILFLFYLIFYDLIYKEFLLKNRYIIGIIKKFRHNEKTKDVKK